jgi:uncharacterized membrane protein YagU involved in acid resistance
MPIRLRDETYKMLAGAAAGFVATVPMTVAMELMHRRLPWTHREPLPPRKITMRAMKAIGVRHKLNESERMGLTLAAHFGYGSGMGAVYGPVSDRVKAPPVVKGMGFGLVVWAASYLGIVPAMGLIEPATRHRAQRNALMIAAHLVWGATLGLLTSWWSPRNAPMHEGVSGARQRDSRGRFVRAQAASMSS